MRPRNRASSSALLIVDVQQAFPVPRSIVEKIERYSHSFSCRIFTRFINPPGSFFRTRLKMTCCKPGSADTVLTLSPREGDIVLNKSTYGLRPAQLTRIKKAGISRVVLCGVETDACVLGIMFSLFDAGIDAEVKPELCWSSTGLHREALKIIAMQFRP